VTRPALAILSLALTGSLALGGCARPLPPEALPDAPLAFVHRTLDRGRDRADRLKELRGESKPTEEGVARLDELSGLFDGRRGAGDGGAPDLQGRPAFYHPRTGEIETIEAFLPGAFPCDWSPDRQRLLVASRQRGAPRLFAWSLERRDLARPVLAEPGTGQLGGSYGPDGRIAWVEARRGPRGITTSVWVTGADGAEPRQVTPGPVDGNVRWSPAGGLLLYESPGPDGRRLIRALDIDDPLAEPRVVARGREARFSPDGQQVVYSRERSGGWRLWRMRPDGSGKTALGHAVQGSADERHPTVSPDGRYVAYVAERDDRQQIRIRAMDGTGDRLLIEDADGTLPVW